MTGIHRTSSFDDLEWAENDYSHPADRVHSPIPTKIEKWHDWIFIDSTNEVINENSFKPETRKCLSCKKTLPKDAPFIVKFCNVACRQLGKK